MNKQVFIGGLFFSRTSVNIFQWHLPPNTTTQLHHLPYSVPRYAPHSSAISFFSFPYYPHYIKFSKCRQFLPIYQLSEAMSCLFGVFLIMKRWTENYKPILPGSLVSQFNCNWKLKIIVIIISTMKNAIF